MLLHTPTGHRDTDRSRPNTHNTHTHTWVCSRVQLCLFRCPGERKGSTHVTASRVDREAACAPRNYPVMRGGNAQLPRCELRGTPAGNRVFFSPSAQPSLPSSLLFSFQPCMLFLSPPTIPSVASPTSPTSPRCLSFPPTFPVRTSEWWI